MAIGNKMKTRGSNIGMLSANGSFSGSNPYNFFSTNNLGMPTLDNPFPNLNTNSNNLLSQEFFSQTNQKELPTAVDNSNRRQGIANLLFALSDAFAGRDIGTGFLTRQASMLPKQATVKELLDGIYNKIQRGEKLTPQDQAVLDTYSKASLEERILRGLGGDYIEESQDNVETKVTQGPKAIGTLPNGQTVVRMTDGSLKVLEN